MPDRRKLQVGDSIKIVRVPEADFNQRVKEPVVDMNMLPTATVIEKTIEQGGVVIIDQVDEYNQPWYSIRIEVDGKCEYHSLAIMDDETWELIHQKDSRSPEPKDHRIAEIKYKIDSIMIEYEEEYQELAEKSEAVYEQQELLKKSYEVLDGKTGLNGLYAELAKLSE